MAEQPSGKLITRNYANFRGVDFSNKEVSIYRSPESLNMWKDYKNNLGKCIETRPSIELAHEFSNTIFGIFFYKVGNTQQIIVHCGTKLYKIIGTTKTELFTGMNTARSKSFIYDGILYIKDGINYKKYDGTTLSDVVGYIPTTSISREPSGGGTIYQDVNMLSPYRRNTFCGDGESTDYYLDAQNLDNEAPQVIIRTEIEDETLVYETDYTYDATRGIVTFNEAPSEPYTDGKDNVIIIFKKTISGYANRILNCTLLEVFDNRVFFSGNPNYPNTIFHSSLNDPSYCSDLDYYNEGLDNTPVRTMIAGNNALWVIKEPSQSNTAIYYHNPTIDSQYGKVYPSSHSSINTGCVADGRNFNDDIVFFSDRGMEAINGDITTEQVIAHRSSLIDAKLLSETNYKNMILEEYEGYLLIIIGNKVYLADSRAMFTNETHLEYEFFYWELSKSITCTQVKDGVLYLGTSDGIYTLTNKATDREITSYWTTPEDEFGYPHYQKTTNKRGCVIDMNGTSVNVSARVDNSTFTLIGNYNTTKDYVVCRIKKKKWKSIQLKFSSSVPFELFSNTLEAYVGGYIKR